MLRFSVIVPTYGRPGYVRVCLVSLIEQATSSSYEVIVVRRHDDEPTRRVVDAVASSSAVSVRSVCPHGAGFMRALRAGVAASSGDAIALTDDDAIYPADWLDRLAAMLDQPGVGGAGGMIREVGHGRARATSKGHGRITVSGRLLGSSYDALPPSVVDVDVLPGANMAYRRTLIDAGCFPELLELNGGAPWNEMLVGALIRQQGLRLLCDTSLTVHHRRAPRSDGDRADESTDRYRLARSRSFVLRHTLGQVGFALFVIRVLLIGESELPGLARLAVGYRFGRARGRDVVTVMRGLAAGDRMARRRPCELHALLERR